MLKIYSLCYIITVNNNISGCVFMAQMKFKTEANGYSVEEVDRYIDMLQAEYKNAVQWSNEIEKQLEDGNAATEAYIENEKLKKENERLLSDCKLLASKLKSLNEPTEKETEKNAACDSDTAKIVNGIISAANKKAQDIVNEAYKTQDMIFSNRISSAQHELDELEERKKKVESELSELARLKKEIIEKLSFVRDSLKA